MINKGTASAQNVFVRCRQFVLKKLVFAPTLLDFHKQFRPVSTWMILIGDAYTRKNAQI
jgi:hypothetical protein